jgi:hypothetical protein
LIVVLFDFGEGVEAAALLLKEGLLGKEGGVDILDIVSDFGKDEVNESQIAKKPFFVASEFGQLGDLGHDLLKTCVFG